MSESVYPHETQVISMPSILRTINIAVLMARSATFNYCSCMTQWITFRVVSVASPLCLMSFGTLCADTWFGSVLFSARQYLLWISWPFLFLSLEFFSNFYAHQLLREAHIFFETSFLRCEMHQHQIQNLWEGRTALLSLLSIFSPAHIDSSLCILVHYCVHLCVSAMPPNHLFEFACRLCFLVIDLTRRGMLFFLIIFNFRRSFSPSGVLLILTRTSCAASSASVHFVSFDLLLSSEIFEIPSVKWFFF